ncbi:endoglucanase [Shewanella avicenniae]|uniref:cellulase n=1 Tax=Shewanella avicenniae TaxID=2814294 RepID=A0ABX7QUX9_9GAMM|nr:glycosyl hydrolase family 8 [Shewanella avicenniae]QSX35312.1 endoglucanase [Shewanella avicenniae]
MIRMFGIMLGLLLTTQVLAQDDWQQYKSRFITDEGRVIDTGNAGISHSEGQGYGMLLAVANDDAEHFKAMWHWARKTLGRQDLPLFSWKFDPNARPHIADSNNASDGDILIAWALLQGGKKWNNSNYLNASRRIRNAVLDNMVLEYAGYSVLLPGVNGFTGNGYIDINLSYWVMPAIIDFAREDNQVKWQQLADSGQQLLAKAKFGDAQLPADWIRISSSGELHPSPNWPARFSFDAIRIALYFSWANLAQDPGLNSIKLFWQAGGNNPPAWIDVNSSEVAPYAASQGILAIRSVVNGKSVNSQLTAQDDYYSASLLLLSKLAESIHQ